MFYNFFIRIIKFIVLPGLLIGILGASSESLIKDRLTMSTVAPSVITSGPSTMQPNKRPTVENTSAVIATEPIISYIDTPVLYSELQYIKFYDIEASAIFIDTLNAAVSEIESAIACGDYSVLAIDQMTSESARLSNIIAAVEADIIMYNKWEQEHYYAAKAWEFFMQYGYSEVIASALIGNMMIETSGGSLNIKPEIYSPNKGYYGLCQWSLYYKPFMAGTSFYEQLNYLHEDMTKEFKTFGFCYKRGFTYKDFLAMTDVREAAIAFAKVYERCGPGTYSMRANCAEKAYNYFVLGK